MDESLREIEHLKLVRGEIARFAGYSLQLKTIAMTLATAMLIFFGATSDPHWLIGVGGIATIAACWSIDARFAHREQCCIKLYDELVNGEEIARFDLDYQRYSARVPSRSKIEFSGQIVGFYLTLIALIIALLVVFVLLKMI